MRLHLSSWPEVEAYLARSKGIVVPIGSTEQHGPTGLIGTDAICPEVIALKAAETEGFLVAPTFNVGIAQHHLGFPGTLTLRPSTMIAAMHDWVASLARHGFERVYFFNGHGGNVSTINAAFSEIYADRSLSAEASNRGPVKLKLANWWDFKPVMDFCRTTYGAGHGSHATPSEIAITQFVYPEAIKAVAEISPKIAPNGRFTDADDYRAKFPDGRIGSDPTLARPQDGERLIGLSAAGLAADYRAFAES
jgi:creatinine amidohydrolase/Fe(II)-dependent formamide hydrolase-like protein